MRTKILTQGALSRYNEIRKGKRIARTSLFLCVLILTVVSAIALGAFSPVVLNFNSTDIFQKNNISASAATADDWLTAVDTSSASAPNTFTLTDNWTAASGVFGTDARAFTGNALYVPSGKSVILDLNGKTLSRGLSSATSNGYVIRVDGTLVIRDSAGGGRITGGYNSTSNRAAGVWINGGTVTMTGGSIANNINSYSGSSYNSAGGVLIASGSFNMEGGTIQGNSAVGGNGTGGILASGGTLNMTGGTVQSNTAGSSYGRTGGIRITYSATHTIQNATIIGNTSTYSSGAGGISVTAGTVNISNTTIKNNTATGATSGGGIFQSSGTVDISNTTIESNTVSGTASTSAGGILASGGTLNMTGGSVSSNTSTTSGSNTAGGIHVKGGAVTLNGTTVYNNTASTSTTAIGGIYLNSGTLCLTSAVVTENKGVVGGGVYAKANFDIGGALQIKDNRLYTSTSSATLLAQHVDVSFTSVFYMSITAALTSDADIRVYPEAVWYSASSFRYIAAYYSTYHKGEDPKTYFGLSTGAQGEINPYQYDSNTEYVTVQCYDNAVNWVRAVNLSGSNRTFKLYSDWTATSGSFGTGTGFTSNALYTGTNASGTLTIDLNGYTINRGLGSATSSGYVLQTRGNVVITDTSDSKAGKITGGNNSSASGGGIYVYNGTLTIRGGAITGNKTSSNGGGVLVYGGATLYLTDDGVISNNTAANGGGIYKESNTSYAVHIQGGTISGNNATACGGGIYFYDGTLNVSGGSMTGNKTTASSGFGGGIYLYSRSTVNLTGGAITGNTAYSGANGGGIYVNNVNTVLNVSGGVDVSGNYLGTGYNDIYLPDNSSARLTIKGALTSGQKIGVYREAGTLFTYDFAKYHPDAKAEDYFTAQRSGYFVETDSSGEGSFNSNNPADAWKIAVVESQKQNKFFTVTLVSDWTAAGSGTSTKFGTDGAAFINNGLYVPSGAKVILDLNGYTLNRNLSSAYAYGYVIYISGGTLTVRDSSEAKTGKIKGGNSSSSSMDMAAGGIGITGSGVLNFEGGTLTECKATYANSAGGIMVYSGTLNLKGGVITGNTGGQGGGIVQYGNYTHVSGNPVVSGNKLSTNVNSDMKIRSLGEMIYVDGALDDTVRIGISMEANNYTGSNIVTGQYSRYNAETDFDKHFFASETTRFMLTSVVSGSYTEVKVFCIDATTNWTNAYNAASSGSWLTMKLYADWTAQTDSSYKKAFGTSTGYSNGAIYLAGSKKIRLDLNGFTINRGLTSSTNTADGYVFYINGTNSYLDIIDSSEGKTGKITGGYSTGTTGGGIRLNSGYLYLNGGTIIQNVCDKGGGVYLPTLDSHVYVGGTAIVAGNTARNGTANNIYAEKGNHKIDVTSALSTNRADTEKIGFYREASGEFTADFQKYNAGLEPADYFTLDMSSAFVVRSDSGEGAVDTNNSTLNWLFAVKGSLSTGLQMTCTLRGNWTGAASTAGFGSDTDAYNYGGLYVPSGANVILDLNGYTLNRGYANSSSGQSYGFVIYVLGTLIVKDTSEAGTGTIKGGFNSINATSSYAYYAGAGINVGNNSNASLTIEGGTVTGNRANGTNGVGGVFVYSGKFVMTGGKITGNSGTRTGGVLMSSSTNISVQGDVVIDSNTLTTGAKSDFSVTNTGYKMAFTGALGENAHIGFTPLNPVNNYKNTLGQVFTSNFGRYNAETDLGTKVFASCANMHGLEKYNTGTSSNPFEVTMICYDAEINWTNAYNAASSGSWLTMKLYADWTAQTDSSYKKAFGTSTGYSNGAIYLAGSKKIRLDLNGFTINRGLTSSTNTADGYVFYIDSTSAYLDIIDSSEGKTGKITGGYSTGTTGGGIRLNSGYLYLNGGTITQNVCDKGGGIYLPTLDSHVYVGGTAIVAGNTARNGTANNIYAEKGNHKIEVTSSLSERADDQKIGFYREGSGEFTSNFQKYNAGREPADYFTLDMASAFVIRSDAGEGAVDTNSSVSNWLYAVKGSIAANIQTTCTLRADWLATASTAGFGSDTDAYVNGALYVPSTANVILDLAGFTLDRRLTTSSSSSGCAYGMVIRVDGKLIIRDSSDGKTGIIKGGNNTSTSGNRYAGGISVYGSNASLTVEGGTITQNRANSGSYGVGGIYVHSGKLIMKGGTVTGNTGTRTGGVLSNSSNTVDVQGDVIIDKNTLTTGASSDFAFTNTSYRMYFTGVLGEKAHIGLTPLTAVNNYTNTVGQVFTSNFWRYNYEADLTTKLFASGVSLHGVEKYKTSTNGFEATLVCYDPQVNWINACAASSSSSPKTMKLYADWTAEYNSSYTTSFHPSNTSYFRNGGLLVPNNDYVILDLNGFTLNRGLTSDRASGYVIWVNGSGKLEIKDSSAAKTGKITGGRSNDTVGGIHLASGAYFKMESGTVTKNVGSVAGGINILGTATMYYGGLARVEENKLTTGVASNILIADAKNTITIVSELQTLGHGIGRAGNGLLTKNLAKYSAYLPEHYFVSELTEYYVAKDVDGEATLMSLYNHINWAYAVQMSLDNSKRTETVRLTGNWTASSDSSYGTSFGTGTGYYSGMLYVPSGASIELDLAGYTVNRDLKASRTYGGVFRVNGTLTIKDDSEEGTGVITGGFTNGSSGVSYGGGITVLGSGICTMLGGSVTKNTATGYAGGVYVASGGSFTLRDAAVVNNQGYEYGGIAVVGSGVLNVGGKAEIHDNTYTKTNTSGLPYDVGIAATTGTMGVVAPLTEGAKIGFSRAINNGDVSSGIVFTRNFGKYNSETAETFFFASDSANYGVIDYYTAGVREAGLFCYNNVLNWQNAINLSISKKNTQTVTLYDNWTADSGGNFGSGTGFSGGALYVPSNASIILDLNGFGLNRNLRDTKSAGEVFYVLGTLKIINNSENDADAVITGGNTTGSWTAIPGVVNGYLLSASRGGGVYVGSGANFTIEGGAIKNNKGVGVYVVSGGTFALGGKAVIADNQVANKQANVFLEEETQIIRIVSKITSEEKIGVIRTKAKEKFATGVLTSNYGKYNTDDPQTHFRSDDPRYYVESEGELEYGTFEGTIISDDGRTNWQYAVKTSIANNGRPQKFTLYKDWIAETDSSTGTTFGTGTGFSVGQLYVPANASIILDLNGYKIDRKLTVGTVQHGGGVIYVRGSLRIIDSNTRGDVGTITGGSTTGGSYSYNNGDGGGISAYQATITMEGGKISGNYATNTSNGTGGIFLSAGSTFKMTGGEISGNYGKVVGGIYAAKDSRVQLGGSARILDCKLLDNSNNRTNTLSNLWFYQNKGNIEVVGAFEDTAAIGLTATVSLIVPEGNLLTVGWSNYVQKRKPDKVFFSDAPDDYVVIDEINKSSGQTEAFVICLDNEANWSMAVRTSLNEGKTQTVKLYSDWKPASGISFGSGTGYTSGAMYVPKYASIILDLNGYTINRGLTSSYSYGYVFYVAGTLTVIDSSAEINADGTVTQGTIRGGYSGIGGAFYMTSQAKLTLEAGNIANNKTSGRGGAIYIAGGLELNIGGTTMFYDNYANDGSRSDIDLVNWKNQINITSELVVDPVNTGRNYIYVRKNAIGAITNGWGANNPDIYPTTRFMNESRDSGYSVVSIGNGVNREAVMFTSDNATNWNYTVQQSLSTGNPQTFVLVSTWYPDNYWTSTYDGRFGSDSRYYRTGGLYVSKNANIIFDFNGYSIFRRTPYNRTDRKYAYPEQNFVIYVEGTVQFINTKLTQAAELNYGSYGIYIAGGNVTFGAIVPPPGANKKDYADLPNLYAFDHVQLGQMRIKGNYRYGVYLESGSLTVTGGEITGNSTSDVYVCDSDNANVRVGLDAYIYTYRKEDTSDKMKNGSLQLANLLGLVRVIAPLSEKAKIGYNRNAAGQLTVGYGKYHPDATLETITKTFVRQEDKEYTLVLSKVQEPTPENQAASYAVARSNDDSEQMEGVIGSYDNATNWQYVVTKSLKTKRNETFNMYDCWDAKPHANFGTAFGTTSAFYNGALYVPEGANVTLNLNGHKLNRCLDGTTRVNGFVIYVAGTLTIIDTQVKEDAEYITACCKDGSAPRPGGEIKGGNNSSGSSGGAIHILSGGTCTLKAGVIHGNNASSLSGTSGAVYTAGAFIMEGGDIRNNNGGNAGGIYAVTGSAVDLKGGTITENTTTGASGGGVYSAGAFDMTGGTISKNKGTVGGVFAANGCTFTMNNGTITENTGSSVGAIFVANGNDTSFTMDGGTISKNQAMGAGGIYAAGNVTVNAGNITENVANGSGTEEGGSAFYIAGSGEVTIVGGLITKNEGRNGVRVFSTGTLNLGAAAKIYGNIEKGTEIENDIFLASDTRKVNIVSQFTTGGSDKANIGIYREKAGVFTDGYGLYNTVHPNQIFHSNRSEYAICKTATDGDLSSEASIGTPIENEPKAVLTDDDKAPVYHGGWQAVIVGYDTAVMTATGDLTLYPGTQWADVTNDGKAEKELQAVNAGTYMIAFVPNDGYCWKDGTNDPKMVVADMMPKVAELTWTDEKHDGKDCVYNGATHGPSVFVTDDTLCVNVLTGEKDTCGITVAGRQVTAGEHTASAMFADNSNYAVPEGEAGQYKFRIEKAELPDFEIVTEKTGFRVATEIEVKGNIENGNLTYEVIAGSGSFNGKGELVATGNVNDVVTVRITVAETVNYKSKAAEKDLTILPAKLKVEMEETEVTYGDTMNLVIDGYDPNEAGMGAVTYTVLPLGGKAELGADGYTLTGTGAGKVALHGVVAASDYYEKTEFDVQITVRKRVLTLDWKNSLTTVYNGSQQGFDNANLIAPTVSGVIPDDEATFRIRVFAGGIVGWDSARLPALWINAGRYDLGVMLSDADNYTLATEAEYFPVFEIKKVPLTLSFKEPLAMHEGVPYTPAIDGNLDNAPVTFTVVSGSSSQYDRVGDVFTPKVREGSITIRATVAETANYEGGTVDGVFNLYPASMPLALKNAEVQYGDVLQLVITGNGEEENKTPVTVTMDSDTYGAYAAFDAVDLTLTAKKVGKVKIHAHAPATEVYQETDVDLDVTIVPRKVTVDWTAADNFIYNDDTAAPSAAIRADGKVLDGDECTVTVEVGYYEGTGNDKTFTKIDWADRHARDYVARAVVTDLNGNYTADEESSEITLTIKPLAVVLAWTAPAAPLPYNGQEQAPDVTVFNLKEGDTCGITVTGTKNAGTGLVAMATAIDNSDYTLEGGQNLSSMEYVIVAKSVTVTWGELELVYTGLPQAPEATVTVKDGLVEGDECKVDVIGAQINVGDDYIATAFSLSNPNYVLDPEWDNTVVFKITKAKMEVKLAEATAVYGTIYELKVDGNIEKGDVTFTFSAETKDKMVLGYGNRMDPVDVGEVVVIVTVGETENYQTTTFTETITVLPRPIVVRWDNLSFEYDGEAHNPVATVENTVHGDLVDVTLSAAQIHAAQYTASVTAVSDKKYVLEGGEKLSENFEIRPRPVTITWVVTTVEYNATMQYPKAAFGNMIEGDVINPIVDGSKDVVVRKLCTLANLNNSNYYLQAGEDDTVYFTVTARKAEIVWGNTEFIYNGTEQGPEARVTNLLGSDTCEVTVSGKEVNVGEYTATVTKLSNENYSLADVENLDMSFHIGKADMTVTLSDNQVMYKQSMPITLLGLEGDGVPAYKLKNGTGTAAIEGESLTGLSVGKVYLNVKVPETANYNAFGGEDGYDFEIDILPQPIEVEWEYDEYLYNGQEQRPVPSIVNLYEGDACEMTVTGNVNAGNGLKAVITSITNPNYTLEGGTDVTATYAIYPKPINVVWEQEGVPQFEYNGKQQGPTAHAVASDLIAGDECGIVVTGWAIDAGKYTAIAASTDNANYIVAGTYDPEEDEVLYPSKDFVILRSTPVIILLNKKVTIGGKDGKLMIEGNVGGGTVTYSIISARDGGVAELQGDTLVAHKVGFVTVQVVVGETANTNQAVCDGEIEIVKGYAPLKLTKNTVSYGSTLTLTLDDDKGFLLAEDGSFIFGPVTFTVHPDDAAKASILGDAFVGKAVGDVRIFMSVEETNNFYATEVEATITVTRRIVTLSWSLPAAPLVYNGTEQSPTATVTNLVEGDSCTVTVSKATNAGDHTSRAISLSNPNYTLERATNTEYDFNVQPLSLEVSWGELVLKYTGVAQTPEAVIHPLPADEGNCSVTIEVFDKDGHKVNAVNVGTYVAKAAGLDNDNYVLSNSGAETEFEIIQTELNPIFTPDSVMYLETVNLVMEGNLDGQEATYTVLKHESVGSVDIENGKMTGTRTGEVKIRVSIPGTVNCKEFEDVLTVTVTPAKRKIDLTTKEGRYGDDFGLSISGNDVEPGAVIYELVQNTNANGDVIAEFLEDGTTIHSYHRGTVSLKIYVAATANYQEAEIIVSLNILPRIAEFKWETTEFNFDGTPKIPTAIITNLVYPERDTYTLTVKDAQTDAGIYMASVTGTANPDYTYVGSLSATTFFTIGKKETKLTLVTTHIRANQPEQLVVEGNEGGMPVKYEIISGAGTGAAELRVRENGNEEYPDIICGTKLGTVLVTATVAPSEDGNHTGASVTTLVMIEKALPEITLKVNTVQYGTDLLLEVEGNVEKGTVIFSSANDTGMASLSGNLLHPTRAGRVYITVTVGPTANYAAFSGVFEVTITPLSVTLRWLQFEFTYDGISTFAPTAKVVGMIGNDTCDVEIEGAQMNAGTYNSPTGPASKRVTKAVSLSNPNYVLAEGIDLYAPTFVINKAKLNIYIINTDITLGEPTRLLVGGNIERGDEGFSVVPGTGDAVIVGNMITGTVLGDITVIASVQETDNYLFATASATISVLKPQTPIELEEVTMEYGDDLTLIVKDGTNPENGAFAFSLADTPLATLEGNVLHANGVGEVSITVTVEETETYRYTEKVIVITIDKRVIQVVWASPELIYDGTEQFPTATVGNLVGEDECTLTVTGAIHAGENIESVVTALSDSDHYTLEGGTDLTGLFTIKPRPVRLSWSEEEFTYNGDIQAPTATVENLCGIDGVLDTATIKVQGVKDAGIDCLATAIGIIDNTDYTVDDGENITHTYIIRPYAVDVEWGELHLVYTGEVLVPTAKAVGTFNDEECFATVSGDGIEAREEPYIATITGFEGGNYVLKHPAVATLAEDGETETGAITTEYYIDRKELTLTDAELTKVYNGEFQQPTFNLQGLHEGDEVVLTFIGDGMDAEGNPTKGGGKDVATYKVTLKLDGKDSGNYFLTSTVLTQWLEITPLIVTVKLSTDKAFEDIEFTGSNLTLPADWFVLTTDGFVGEDAGKSVEEIFTVNELSVSPKFKKGDTYYDTLFSRGVYTVIPVLNGGELKGAENYKAVLSIDETYGTVTVSGGAVAQLTAESKYQFMFEEYDSEYGAYYRTTYAEADMEHGKDDAAFERAVLGQILPKTTIADFVVNFVNAAEKVTLYKGDVAVYANGAITDGFETAYVGTGWRMEYGDDALGYDTVYLSVLGDVDGDGKITRDGDVEVLIAYNRMQITFTVEFRLAARVNNGGCIGAGDVSAILCVISEHNPTKIEDFYYMIEIVEEA